MQRDVLDVVGRNGWDLMVAHPPCRYLTGAGARWWLGREAEQDAAAAFFMALFDAPIPRVCVENPAGAMSTRFRKPDQYIQPWQFGHPESKRTGLWLRGLAPLAPSRVLPHRDRWENQTATGQNKLGPGPNRWRERSRTYTGIAEAMAEQWGSATRAPTHEDLNEGREPK